MSRSRRHHPVCNVVKPDGKFKKFFNRRVRRTPIDAIPSGNSYRKLGESWMIHDCREYGLSYIEYCRRYGHDASDPEVRYEYERMWVNK